MRIANGEVRVSSSGIVAVEGPRLAALLKVILPSLPKVHFSAGGFSDSTESDTAFGILWASRSSLLSNRNSSLDFALYLTL